MDAIIDTLADSKMENYAISGIVQFLKTQSMKNEIIRAQWNVEKAELQARIAFLQGERKGQENLKTDLVKRIKMLEYSLQQENHKLIVLKSQKSIKCDTNIESNITCVNKDIRNSNEKGSPKSSDKKSFNLKDIRQFLVDNGYREMMSEIRESRVKQLLGLSNDLINPINLVEKDNLIAQSKSNNTPNHSDRNFPTQIDISPEMNFHSENYKYENFDNKSNENYDDSPIYDTVDDSLSFDEKFVPCSVGNQNKMHGDYPISSDKLPHSEILVNSESNSVLGELASLTIANDAADPESNIENIDSTPKHTNRISWTPKFSLRSHFDSIRCLNFHETKPLLITGSEDRCLKLWNLVKTYHMKKSSSSFEMEPIYTFRGHRAPILSLVVNEELVYSGDLDGEIRIWNIPNRVELYDEFNSSVSPDIILKHPNAIWSLSHQKSTNTLLSGSADGIVYLWDTSSLMEKPQKKISLTKTAISSTSFLPSLSDNFIVGTGKGEVLLVNTETGQTVCSFASEEEMSTVYKLIIHPTKSLIISGHEDRKIRIFDVVSGKLVSSLVAHLDAVTSVAIENKSGLNHVLSSSHDCSIRLWDLSSQACVQETTSHRKKFDESINDIAVHPSLQYFASGGSDAIAKVFI